MGAYIARRLFSTLLVMAIVGVIVFLLLHLAPGSPAAIIAGDNATPAQIVTDQPPTRAGPAAAGAVRALGLARAARAVRHLDLLRRAGDGR